MENISIRQAKQADTRFNINEEKKAVCKLWTTPESEYGFGYTSAALHPIHNNIYQLWLDGELSEVWYAIYDNGNTISLEPTHWYEA